MGIEMFDMWNAMKQSSYTRVIRSLEETIDSFDGSDFEEIIKLCLDKVSMILHTEAASFWLYHLNGDGLIKPHAFRGGSDISHIRLFPNEGIVGRVISSGEAVIIEDCQNDPNFATRVDNSTGFVTKTMICVPTKIGDTAFGCIQLINKDDGSLFDDRDYDLASKLADKIVEILQKRNILEQYGFGVNDEVANVSRGGKVTNIATLFVDIAGFVQLSRSVKTAALANVINSFVIYIYNIITKNNGQFDKTMGDKVMAFWGAPDEIDNPAYYACKAALEIVDGIDELKKTIKSHYNADISLKVSVGYGEAFAGNIGVDHSLDYTVIGSSVNEAALISDMCEPNMAYISDAAYDKASYKGHIEARRVDRIKLDKDESIDVYLLKSVS